MTLIGSTLSEMQSRLHYLRGLELQIKQLIFHGALNNFGIIQSSYFKSAIAPLDSVPVAHITEPPRARVVKQFVPNIVGWVIYIPSICIYGSV